MTEMYQVPYERYIFQRYRQCKERQIQLTVKLLFFRKIFDERKMSHAANMIF